MVLNIMLNILVAIYFSGALVQGNPDLLPLPIRCPQNQTYKNQGEDCQNCVLYRKGIEVDCQLSNETKCYCKDNYIRISNNNRSCVLRKDCPPLCDENETEEACANLCPPSCRDINRPPCPFFVCRRGCNCKPGYVRNDDTKKCIPLSECKNPMCHDKNEFYGVLCSCEKTCQNTPKMCLQVCRKECLCRRGYLRDEITRRCVRIAQCPPAK